MTSGVMAILTSIALLVSASSSRAASEAAQHAIRNVTSPRQSAAGTPFREVVSLPIFMEHVLSPAAEVVWRASGTVADATGLHDLAPTTDAQWEAVVSGAATLAEAVNALIIPQRRRNSAWYPLAALLRNAAKTAYEAAEAHDPKAIALAGQRIDSACTSCHKYYGLE